MRTIKISEIKIPENRQRRNFDLKSLNELGESIQRTGLLHPIVLRSEISMGPAEGVMEWFLVAGERRLRAILDLYALGGRFQYDGQLVPEGEVPFSSLGELDELAREEAELDENIRRVDLSWQERAEATSRLASLRSRQAVAAGRPEPSITDLTREIKGIAADVPAEDFGVHHQQIRREIIVAKHLADPEVRGAKDVGEAWKILKRKEDTAKRVQLAAEVGRTFSTADHTLLHTDALVWLAACPAGQFDVICTDPIYGIGADQFGDSGGRAGPTGAHFYEDSYETWQSHIAILAREGFRITKPQAHLYAFCDITRFEEFKQVLTAAGWTCFRTPIVWHKPNGNRLPWVESGPQRKWEIILYAKKGDKKVTRIYPDLVSYSADENKGHNAQKPVALFRDLLARSVSAGDFVLDPFAGSCPILPAAHELKVRATALEQDAAAYAIGLKRLQQLQEEPELVGL